MSKSFPTFLTEITDRNIPIPTINLSQLSDIDEDSCIVLAESWPKIEVVRRREIMRQLADLCQHDFTVEFTAIALLGLQDSDSYVRLAAIDTLWDSENTGLIPRLIELMHNDPEITVQASAANTLGQFVLMGELGEISDQTFTHLSNTLLQIVRDASKSPLLRCRALESIAAADLEEIPTLIRDAYQSEIDTFRVSAIAAMGRTADESWAPKILKELYSIDPSMRYHAVIAAGQLELEEATMQLVELLEDPNPEVVRASISALGNIGSDEAREALELLIDDPVLLPLVEEAIESIDLASGTSSISYNNRFL
ncbi:MAG: HEAT repeat domain-containing protein [Anaerolineales bacterium]|nr:HEAT repeat domain-containing protein [Anaerolineales bacterium]